MREDIYLRRGGVSVFRENLLRNHDGVITDKMGHVIIDKISSFEIRSSEDVEIADFIATKMLSDF